MRWKSEKGGGEGKGEMKKKTTECKRSEQKGGRERRKEKGIDGDRGLCREAKAQGAGD